MSTIHPDNANPEDQQRVTISRSEEENLTTRTISADADNEQMAQITKDSAKDASESSWPENTLQNTSSTQTATHSSASMNAGPESSSSLVQPIETSSSDQLPSDSISLTSRPADQANLIKRPFSDTTKSEENSDSGQPAKKRQDLKSGSKRKDTSDPQTTLRNIYRDLSRKGFSRSEAYRAIHAFERDNQRNEIEKLFKAVDAVCENPAVDQNTGLGLRTWKKIVASAYGMEVDTLKDIYDGMTDDEKEYYSSLP
ncbi:uncharacterized protein V2V93DRAFT_371359 [Kockiozyma suomiensis]|uniref:uncharacterized protein n=1 Tax=Kockiozyma suomiensis TaxID=1337062 RepID=UPI003342F1DF